MALLTAPKSEATGAAAAKWKQGRLEDPDDEDGGEGSRAAAAAAERRSRRKRWRDKQQRRFVTLRSFAGGERERERERDRDRRCFLCFLCFDDLLCLCLWCSLRCRLRPSRSLPVVE